MKSNRTQSALPSRSASSAKTVDSPLTSFSYKSPSHASTISPYLTPVTQRPQHASPPQPTEVNSQIDSLKRQLAVAQQDITLLRNLIGEQSKSTGVQAPSSEAVALKKQLDEANQARSWLQAELAASRARSDGLQMELKAREKKVMDERDTAIQRCKILESELQILKIRKASETDRSVEIHSLHKQLESEHAQHKRLLKEKEEEEGMLRLKLTDLEARLMSAESRLRLVHTEKECQTEEMLRSSWQKEDSISTLKGLLAAAQDEAHELRMHQGKERQALQEKLDASQQKLSLLEGRCRAFESEIKSGADREERLKRRVHEAESATVSLQSRLNDAERKARDSERLRTESERLKSSSDEVDRQRLVKDWEARLESEVAKRKESELSRNQVKREFEGYRSEVESEVERSLQASEAEEKRLRSELSHMEVTLSEKTQEALDLKRRLSEERLKWSLGYEGLEAERKRLDEEWRRVEALRAELQREAESVHAMGVLSSARTLRFDLSSSTKGEGSLFTSPNSRPTSAAPSESGAAQRLGGLVRELQDQVATQSREIVELKRQQMMMHASGGVGDEEAREEEIARLKGLNSELHRLCDRLQRDGSVKAKLADDLASQLSDQKKLASEQKARAQSLTIDKLEYQRLTADQEELRRQLEAAKRAIEAFANKYEVAERTIVGQDTLISQLKAEIEGTRSQQRPPRIPSASPSRHKTAWEPQGSQQQFGGTVSRRDFGNTSLDSLATSRDRPDSASSPLRPSGASNSGSFTYGPGGWGGVNGGLSSPSSQLDRTSPGRAKKTYLMM